MVASRPASRSARTEHRGRVLARVGALVKVLHLLPRVRARGDAERPEAEVARRVPPRKPAATGRAPDFWGADGPHSGQQLKLEGTAAHFPQKLVCALASALGASPHHCGGVITGFPSLYCSGDGGGFGRPSAIRRCGPGTRHASAQLDRRASSNPEPHRCLEPLRHRSEPDLHVHVRRAVVLTRRREVILVGTGARAQLGGCHRAERAVSADERCHISLTGLNIGASGAGLLIRARRRHTRRASRSAPQEKQVREEQEPTGATSTRVRGHRSG